MILRPRALLDSPSCQFPSIAHFFPLPVGLYGLLPVVVGRASR